MRIRGIQMRELWSLNRSNWYHPRMFSLVFEKGNRLSPIANPPTHHTEIIDFGYPQNTETDTLKMYITTEGVHSSGTRSIEDSSRITMQATGALSWRKPDIRYRKNEAFVDVIEDVNLLMSAGGTVLRADVSGQIIMRAYLSGMPDCKFGLNDRLLLDPASLAQGGPRWATRRARKRRKRRQGASRWRIASSTSACS